MQTTPPFLATALICSSFTFLKTGQRAQTELWVNNTGLLVTSNAS